MLEAGHCLLTTYTKVFQIVNVNGVAEEVEQSILEHASVAVRENEAVAIKPVRILGVEGHKLIE